MKRLEFTYQTQYAFDAPIHEHHYTLKIYPRENERQHVESLFEAVSYGDGHSYSADGFGNRTLYGNIDEPHDRFYFKVTGTVIVDGSRQEQDDRLLAVFRTPSLMTRVTPKLKETLQRAVDEAKEKSCYGKEFTDMTELEKMLYLSDYCHELLEYRQNVTNIYTSASEALELGEGVCQDYSHILIAFLRMVGIPARYVVGMMLGEGYTHAWVEAYYDGCWHGMDPTNCKLVDEGYIKLSHGRDYNDTLVCKGHFYGKAQQTQEIMVSVVEVAEASDLLTGKEGTGKKGVESEVEQ